MRDSLKLFVCVIRIRCTSRCLINSLKVVFFPLQRRSDYVLVQEASNNDNYRSHQRDEQVVGAVSVTFGTSGCSKSVCFNSSCLARIPDGLSRLVGVTHDVSCPIIQITDWSRA